MLIKISLHFLYDSVTNEVIDERSAAAEPLDPADLGTKIRIYEDRVDGWFFRPVETLLQDGNADYAALLVTIAQIEGQEHLREGVQDNSDSGRLFAAGLMRVCGAITEDDALLCYGVVRSGLFHEGFTKSKVFISREFQKPIQLDDRHVMVNAELLFQAVRADFSTFIKQLHDEHETALRTKFTKVWDRSWKAAKGTPPSVTALTAAMMPPSGSR